ncbi:sulfite exporter TauE/SafE family protein [Phycicoccus sonneratiae]|uniref:Sulfite exporter TauE/SafE family protein n=1 Tax=Phycicoccus sonneratiae TaxID=2807628 RepID=A0ABS2CM89_9MICO|nr:sulfite exporter TauE/SafE family protein [Phycicoccus sonneraticus]MBM6401001.1 sulfite exporter TauE/SafE family protein [Phycicoccus sonneraticus]
MLTSISPFGERARASRWWLTTTAYVLSSALGGTAVGLLAALLGTLVPERWRWSGAGFGLAALLLVVGLLLDLGVGGARLPSWRRQVDEAWIGRYRGWVVGVGFGAQLGLGVVTIVTSSTTYAVLVLAALGGTPWAGALLGLVFGLVRALPLVGMAGVHSREQLWAVLRRVELGARAAEVVARVGLSTGAAALVWTAMGGVS